MITKDHSKLQRDHRESIIAKILKGETMVKLFSRV